MLLVRIDILGNEVSENRNGKHNIVMKKWSKLAGNLKSAAGSAKMGRDEHKQAIFSLRGEGLPHNLFFHISSGVNY